MSSRHPSASFPLKRQNALKWSSSNINSNTRGLHSGELVLQKKLRMLASPRERQEVRLLNCSSKKGSLRDWVVKGKPSLLAKTKLHKNSYWVKWHIPKLLHICKESTLGRGDPELPSAKIPKAIPLQSLDYEKGSTLS